MCVCVCVVNSSRQSRSFNKRFIFSPDEVLISTATKHRIIVRAQHACRQTVSHGTSQAGIKSHLHTQTRRRNLLLAVHGSVLRPRLAVENTSSRPENAQRERMRQFPVALIPQMRDIPNADVSYYSPRVNTSTPLHTLSPAPGLENPFTHTHTRCLTADTNRRPHTRWPHHGTTNELGDINHNKVA